MSTRVPQVPLKIPPLKEGDRLTRAEFQRRYEAMPEDVKAELIEGVVYMASPARFESHGHADARLVTWLGVYQASTLGTDCAANGTVRMSDEDEPQPDSFLFIRPEFGGQVHISSDDYIENSPDLIVEIAASSVKLDLGPKFRSYAKHGVREYLVWRTLDDAIDWFVLRNGTYVPLSPDAVGIIRSEVFPGLWLDVKAASSRRRNDPGGAPTRAPVPEHARFVVDLQSRRSA